MVIVRLHIIGTAHNAEYFSTKESADAFISKMNTSDTSMFFASYAVVNHTAAVLRERITMLKIVCDVERERYDM